MAANSLSIFEQDPLDAPDPLHDTWKVSLEQIQHLLANPDVSIAKTQLAQRAAADIHGTIRGCLFGVLSYPQQAMTFWKQILAVPNGLETCSHEIQSLVTDKLRYLNLRARNQILWLLNELILRKRSEAVPCLLECVKLLPIADMDDTAKSFFARIVELMHHQKQWLISQPHVAASVVYKFGLVLLIICESDSTSTGKLISRTGALISEVWKAQKDVIIQSGRDMLRMILRLRPIETLQSLQETAKTTQTMQTMIQMRTSRKLISLGVTQRIEQKLRYLLTTVSQEHAHHYLNWLASEHLQGKCISITLASWTRWTVTVLHPPAKLVHSNIFPRWAFIKWMLQQCQSEATSVHVLDALFFDWFVHDASMDSSHIMCLEPGVLLLHHLASDKSMHAEVGRVLQYLATRPNALFDASAARQVHSSIRNCARECLRYRIIKDTEALQNACRAIKTTSSDSSQFLQSLFVNETEQTPVRSLPESTADSRKADSSSPSSNHANGSPDSTQASPMKRRRTNSNEMNELKDHDNKKAHPSSLTRFKSTIDTFESILSSSDANKYDSLKKCLTDFLNDIRTACKQDIRVGSSLLADFAAYLVENTPSASLKFDWEIFVHSTQSQSSNDFTQVFLICCNIIWQDLHQHAAALKLNGFLDITSAHSVDLNTKPNVKDWVKQIWTELGQALQGMQKVCALSLLAISFLQHLSKQTMTKMNVGQAEMDVDTGICGLNGLILLLYGGTRSKESSVSTLGISPCLISLVYHISLSTDNSGWPTWSSSYILDCVRDNIEASLHFAETTDIIKLFTDGPPVQTSDSKWSACCEYCGLVILPRLMVGNVAGSTLVCHALRTNSAALMYVCENIIDVDHFVKVLRCFSDTPASIHLMLQIVGEHDTEIDITIASISRIFSYVNSDRWSLSSQQSLLELIRETIKTYGPNKNRFVAELQSHLNKIFLTSPEGELSVALKWLLRGITDLP